MQLIAPDIFAEVARLSWGACALGFALGLLVWLTGWWQHRFWIVASLTALVGLTVQARFDSWKSNRGSRMKAKVLAGLSEDERTALKKASAAKASAFGKFFKPKKAG